MRSVRVPVISAVGALLAGALLLPACATGRYTTQSPRGPLDKELIRRTIRRHLNEVKFCYEKELTRNQALQGRVRVQFTISPTGSVASSIVQSSTMGSPPVEQCIAGVVRRWEFPRPQGGIVIVTYPFILKSSVDHQGPTTVRDPAADLPVADQEPSVGERSH